MNKADIKATILLVDDDHDVLAANARFLRINDFEVIISDHAEIALERLVENNVQIIITDLRMPDCDGLEFISQVRETHPRVPVLFFSGYAEVSDIVRAMKLGAVDFLEKPVAPEELLNKLNIILATHMEGTTLRRQAFQIEQDTPFKQRVRSYEKHLIQSCLAKHNGSISDVLSELDMNRRTLNDKMLKLGIKRIFEE